MKIIGISGSLRKASFNTALLNAAAELAPEGVDFQVLTLHGIPLYDGDLEEAEGIPAAVQALKDAIKSADGVILSTPEYNSGMPGVFKNALDWASRPPQDRAEVLGGRPFAVIGSTPSILGTALAQQTWLPILKALGVDLWSQGSLIQPRAHTEYDADGKLVDEAARKRVADFVAGFAAYIQTKG